MKTTTPDDGDLPLFDRARMRAETLAARDEAIEAVDRAADPEWKAEALAAVREMALRRDEFTSDDVWDAGLAKTREDRALGPIARRAGARGPRQPEAEDHGRRDGRPPAAPRPAGDRGGARARAIVRQIERHAAGRSAAGDAAPDRPRRILTARSRT